MSGDMEEKPVATPQEAQLRMTAILIERGIVTSCMNCGYWDRSTDRCRLYDLLPPPAIIAGGCASWDELLPF